MRSDNIIDLVIALHCGHLCTLSGHSDIHIQVAIMDNGRIGPLIYTHIYVGGILH